MKKRSEYALISTPAGVEKIKKASEKLNDDLLEGLTEDETI